MRLTEARMRPPVKGADVSTGLSASRGRHPLQVPTARQRSHDGGARHARGGRQLARVERAPRAAEPRHRLGRAATAPT